LGGRIFSGSRPREIRHGEATSFEEARAAFLPAWIAFAKSRRPEDFEEYREQARFTAEKYARFDRGECMPLNRPILQFEPVDRFERVSLSGRNFGLAFRVFVNHTGSTTDRTFGCYP